MEIIRKIDIHAHVAPYPSLTPPTLYEGITWISADELIARYDTLGIEYGVLQPLVSPEGLFFTMTNEAIKLTVDAHPDRFFWFCCVDGRSVSNSADANIGHLLEHYMKLGARGLGEYTTNLYVDDPKNDNVFHYAEELDLPLLFHISPAIGYNYGIVDEVHLPRLEKMLKKHPRLKFIGHSQPFWAEISDDYDIQNRNDYPKGKVTDGTIARLLRNYDNLYCDLSAGSGMNAMTRDPEYAVSFMNEFQDRLLYGCDICTPTGTHPEKLCAFLDGLRADGSLSASAYYKIVRGNAEKILKL